MELDNEDVLLGMTISAVILGIGLSMFFIPPYTGYGAVVLAIGMMTLALMITARPRVIERVKREIVLQPSRQTEPTPITPPAIVIPPQAIPPPASNENQREQDQETTPANEQQPAEQTTPTQEPELEKKEEEPIAAAPTPS